MRLASHSSQEIFWGVGKTHDEPWNPTASPKIRAIQAIHNVQECTGLELDSPISGGFTCAPLPDTHLAHICVAFHRIKHCFKMFGPLGTWVQLQLGKYGNIEEWFWSEINENDEKERDLMIWPYLTHLLKCFHCQERSTHIRSYKHHRLKVERKTTTCFYTSWLCFQFCPWCSRGYCIIMSLLGILVWVKHAKNYLWPAKAGAYHWVVCLLWKVASWSWVLPDAIDAIRQHMFLSPPVLFETSLSIPQMQYGAKYKYTMISQCSRWFAQVGDVHLI